MAKRIDPRLIDRLAAEYEPKMVEAFLASINQIKDRVKVGQVEDALRRGDVEDAIRLIGFDPLDFRPLSREIATTYEAGGFATAKAIEKAAPKASQLIIRFDARHVRAENWIAERSAKLITGNIVEDQISMLRSVMYNGLSSGSNPRTVALDIVGRVNKRTGNREGGILGLTERQVEWQNNYLKEITSDNPGELRKALQRELRDKRFDRVIVKAIKDGKPINAAMREKMVRSYRNKSLFYRGETIARTETLDALNAANHEAYQQAVDNGSIAEQDVKRFAHTARDERVRHDHRLIPGMNSEGVGLNESFRTPDGPYMTAPFGIQCLPAHTLVSPGDWTTLTRRVFDGEMITINTTTGNKLSCTPNHPILTLSGWVFAKDIKPGHKVVNCAGGERGTVLTYENGKNVPTAIDKIFEAASVSFNASVFEVEISPHDFHGDGSDTEVTIVNPDSGLRDVRGIPEHFSEGGFEMGTGVDKPFSPLSHCRELFDSFNGILSRRMGGSYLIFSLLWRHLGPFDRFRFTAGACRNFIFGEKSVDSTARDTESLRELVDRLAPSVSVDDVAGIDREPFCGHVYNLETRSGAYVAENILTHNCRCWVETRIDFLAGVS